LTFGTPVVIVRALENEAQAFRREADIPGFAPTQEIEGNLANAVAPPMENVVERFDTTVLTIFQSLQARILGLSDGVIEMKLRSECHLR